MTKFGTLKTKILQNLTEAYVLGKKDVIKDTLKLMKENKEFLNMYLFYEEVENKNIEDKKEAELYVEEIIPLLRKHSKGITKFCKTLDKKFNVPTTHDNDVYSYLDILSEDDSLKNINKKGEAKKELVNHLMVKKEIPEPTSTTIIENTSLLHTILSSNFNALYGNTLNEEEKKQLTEILSISESDLKTNFSILQEEVTTKMGKLLAEEKNTELRDKLNRALEESKTLGVSKYNYYKLQVLKTGL